jgi:hypothetical protein
MSYKVLVKQEAYNEALAAYLYYEEVQVGLGERFLAGLEWHLDDLSKNPQYYSILQADKLRVLRDVQIKKFPFLIIFEITRDEVIVYAIHNTHRLLPLFE